MTIEPINDHVCIIQRPAEEQIGRIIIAEVAKEAPLLGDIVATGPDVKQVTADDAIVFAQYTGVPVRLEGVDYLMMREEEILAIVRE